MSGFFAEEFEPDLKGSNPGMESAGAGTLHKGNGHDTDPWPVLGAAAYYGLAGEIVCTMAPQTEADPVALLLQLLVYTGNAIGRGPYFLIGKDRHYTNLYGMLAGKTGKARKGLSAGHIRDHLENVDPEWAEHRIRNGMSSGEGLIFHVRDPISALRKNEMVVIDPGVTDKRVLLNEQEFFSVLAAMQRPGNTLSGVVRKAWDCAPVLETLVKKEPNRASKAFISIVGHITIDELKQSLDHTSMANGYANRFLFACVDRSKELPLGGDEVDLSELVERTRVVVEVARTVERVTMSDSAKALSCKLLRHRLNTFALTRTDQPRNIKRAHPSPGLMAQAIQEWLQPTFELAFPIRRRVPMAEQFAGLSQLPELVTSRQRFVRRCD